MPEETKKVTMYVYKNVSAIPLQIPELNLTIPKGGFSTPIPAPTETIKVYLEHKMLEVETTQVGDVAPNTNSGVIAGNTNTNDMQGRQMGAVATPQYLPVQQTNPQSRIANYENKPSVRDAVANTVVAIRGDGINPNPYGEIPGDAMASILQKQGRQGFSSEISTADYIDDQAQKIISGAAGAQRSAVSMPGTVPPGTPAELVTWFQQTPMQKKIAVFKATDTAQLNSIRTYERDPNIIACIDTKLSEMAAGK